VGSVPTTSTTAIFTINKEVEMGLHLSRREGQKIVIDGGRVVVTVKEIRCGRVTLNVEADQSIKIDREEVHECIVGAQPLTGDEP
jgi:carbon storage regulator CsrA